MKDCIEWQKLEEQQLAWRDVRTLALYLWTVMATGTRRENYINRRATVMTAVKSSFMCQSLSLTHFPWHIIPRTIHHSNTVIIITLRNDSTTEEMLIIIRRFNSAASKSHGWSTVCWVKCLFSVFLLKSIGNRVDFPSSSFHSCSWF